MLLPPQPPKISLLILRTMNVISYQVCDYIMLLDKWDFAEVIKVTNQLMQNKKNIQLV